MMDKDIRSRLSFINYSVEEIFLKKNNQFKPEGKHIEVNYNINHTDEYIESRM